MEARRNHGLRTAWATVAFAAAALSMAAAAPAQDRLSLADRVSRLEQQAQQSQGGVGLVNQVQDLQSQVQQLQGQVEELQHQLQQMQDGSKAQYTDLDSRIARLEGRAPAGAPAAASSDGGAQQLQDVQLGAPPVASAPAASASDAAPSASSSGDPQADYDRAFSALRNGDFAAASRLFSAFIQAYPDTPLTPNAYYWLGESYYGTQNYPIALDTFNKLLQRFPADAKAPGAMLKVGYCQYELKQWDAARATLTAVTQKYPDSQEARLAEGRLRALDLQTGH
jgi:tol-pal system protein YbgF